jgi:putative Mn2+ efflux pump MntP
LPEYRFKWRALIAFPVAWSLGAMVVGLTSLDRPVITLIAVVIIALTGLLARRVDSDNSTPSP